MELELTAELKLKLFDGGQDLRAHLVEQLRIAGEAAGIDLLHFADEPIHVAREVDIALAALRAEFLAELLEVADAFSEAAFRAAESAGRHAADIGLARAIVHGTEFTALALTAAADLAAALLAALALALSGLLAALLALAGRLTLAFLALLTLALLALLTLLALARLLTLALALLTLAALTLLALLTALSGLLATLTFAAELLHLRADAFEAIERGLEALLIAARALLLACGVFGFLHAVGEAVERLGDGLFAQPDVRAIALPEVLAHELHLDVDIFAVEFAERLADF